MHHPRYAASLFAAPCIAVAGSHRTSLGVADDGLLDDLGRELEITRIDPAAGATSVRRDLRRALDDGGCEAVLLLDTSRAGAAVAARRGSHAPIAALVTADDIRPRGLLRAFGARSIARLDDLLIDDDDLRVEARRRFVRPAVTAAPPVARVLPEPPPAALDQVTRLLKRLPPGRLVIAMPWPDDPDQLRWYRDAVAPLLLGSPACLLLGAPSRREARLIVGATGMRTEFRVHTGPVNAATLAAAARCADVFVIPGQSRAPVSLTDLLLGAICSRVPVVAGGAIRSEVLEHERNALVVDPYDAFSMTSTLNTLLSLPAVQRHYLGEEFAQHTLDRWTWARAAAVYVERLSALVGRPRIPAELRAA
jgi:glycosyltransferase involved in cell wall biosynthesis